MKNNNHQHKSRGCNGVSNLWLSGIKLKSKMQMVLSSISVVFLFMLYSCGGGSGNQGKGDSAEGRIKIDGSSTVYPISEAIAEEYRIDHPSVRITVGLSGTGGGFKKFSRGETDISDASRPIKEGEIEQCKANGIEYIGLTVAYDGMAVLVNPENDWVDSITVEELKKIWEPEAQKKITKWDQIREEWPNKKINLYGPGSASGTYDYFTKVIVGESGSSRGDFTASEDDNVLVQGIAGDKYGLGFFGLAYFEENQDKLKLVAVDSGDGPVKPDIETVSDNIYKPLSRPVFIYVNKDAAKRKVVRDFVEFYLTNAKNLVQDVGYVPLPDDRYEEELNKFKQFTADL
ncbi:MAG: PstS family phosphate ABC transporter substrate-binding protein [Bacteroidales bacterium]